jgi:hypothetical protein
VPSARRLPSTLGVMSRTTLYLAIGAALLVGLWLVNAVFYRRRYGSFVPRSAERQAPGRGRLGGHDFLAASLFVGMLLLAKAAPFVMPGSSFSLWLEEPYAFLVYCAWAWVFATAVYVVARLMFRGR